MTEWIKGFEPTWNRFMAYWMSPIVTFIMVEFAREKVGGFENHMWALYVAVIFAVLVCSTNFPTGVAQAVITCGAVYIMRPIMINGWLSIFDWWGAQTASAAVVSGYIANTIISLLIDKKE